MHIVESYQPIASQHLLVDEIYAPSLSTPAVSLAANKAAMQAQQRQKAITELHRFLESSCDCV